MFCKVVNPMPQTIPKITISDGCYIQKNYPQMIGLLLGFPHFPQSIPINPSPQSFGSPIWAAPSMAPGGSNGRNAWSALIYHCHVHKNRECKLAGPSVAKLIICYAAFIWYIMVLYGIDRHRDDTDGNESNKRDTTKKNCVTQSRGHYGSSMVSGTHPGISNFDSYSCKSRDQPQKNAEFTMDGYLELSTDGGTPK